MSDVKTESIPDLTDSETEQSDDEEELSQSEYDSKYWPSRDTPNGGAFKGNSLIFTNAMVKVKGLLKKGFSKTINKQKLRVLDVKHVGTATEVCLEISDKGGRGKAAVVFWGPNKKKSSILIKKIKSHDSRFVKILGQDLIEPILAEFIAGHGSNDQASFSNVETKIDSSYQCAPCDRRFVSDRYLKAHVTRIHGLGRDH